VDGGWLGLVFSGVRRSTALSLHPTTAPSKPQAHPSKPITYRYNPHQKKAVPDSMVKVFDLRYSLRPLFTVPSPAPVGVAWHPLLPMSVVVASMDGSFAVTDVSNAASAHNYQVGVGRMVGHMCGWMGL